MRAAIDDGAGARFLKTAADPAKPVIRLRCVVVVAHPDDESIGCGALMRRLPDLTIVHVTDGAPRSLTDAKARGFATAEAYAAARRVELAAAVAVAGVGPEQLVALDWPDQEASLHLPEITRYLVERLAGADVVLTHAYEGGQPDHDACALAVHAACTLMKREGSASPAIVEMPLYRAGPDGWLSQSFEPLHGAEAVVVELAPDEQGLKRAMYAAHASQRDMVALFAIAREWFRIAPSYDFTSPPNGGKLLYEQFDWGMTGARWLPLARAALDTLGLDRA
jgi:LmbE family N-acetylglucosaminyl deacetylase